MDVAELRQDVRELFATGSPQVELVCATRDEFEAVRDAMREDGRSMVLENHGEAGGSIVVMP